MKEHSFLRGIIRVRELPEPWDRETFEYWWRPPCDQEGRVIGSSRMSTREKERYTVCEAENLLTFDGQANFLQFIGTASGTVALFSQYFSVGTGAVSQVAPADNSVLGELFRTAPTSTSVVGTSQTLSAFFNTTDAVGTWTNCGMYGGGSATSTVGTGVLMSHCLLSYVKDDLTAITCDYVFNFTFSS